MSSPDPVAAARPLDVAAAAIVIGLCVSWGGNQVAVKLAIPEIPPLTQGAVRSAAAALIVLAWAQQRGVRLVAHDGTLRSGTAAGLLWNEACRLVDALRYFCGEVTRVQLELLGEGWSLVFDEGLASLRVDERDKTTILRRLNDPAADQVAAFLEAVASGEPSAVATGYADALQTLSVCHAAALSAREGRPVELASLEV